MKKYFYFSSLFLLGMTLLFIDFYSKAYVYHIMPTVDDPRFFMEKKIEIFHNFFGVNFSLNLILNKGAAWGILSSFQLPLEIVRIIVACSLLVYLFFFAKDRKKDIPFLFIVVGAFGNIIDFFLYGSVVDFFHLTFWGYHFPVFNIADILITTGVILLFFKVSKQKSEIHAQ